MNSASVRNISPLLLSQAELAYGESDAWLTDEGLWRHFERGKQLQMKQSRKYALNGRDAQNPIQMVTKEAIALTDNRIDH